MSPVILRRRKSPLSFIKHEISWEWKRGGECALMRTMAINAIMHWFLHNPPLGNSSQWLLHFVVSLTGWENKGHDLKIYV